MIYYFYINSIPSPCTAGTYAPLTGQTACISCQSGVVAPGKGYTACVQCPQGKLSPIANLILNHLVSRFWYYLSCTKVYYTTS
jgi:hypothetical protein